MAGSLVAFVLLTFLTATSQSIEALALWRLLTGLGASGVVPLALVLVARLFPYEKRGRPLGWLFGAMAGGRRHLKVCSPDNDLPDIVRTSSMLRV